VPHGTPSHLPRGHTLEEDVGDSEGFSAIAERGLGGRPAPVAVGQLNYPCSREYETAVRALNLPLVLEDIPLNRSCLGLQSEGTEFSNFQTIFMLHSLKFSL
jgi:hypothetical protein